MKPLSVWNYYKNNIKKLIIIFITISLSVFLLYTIQMLVTSSFHTEYLSYVEPQKHYSSILRKEKLLEPALVESIKAQKSAGYVMPWVMYYTNITCTIEETGTKILSVNSGDMKLLISAMDMKLTEGRLPEPGSEEVVLHRLVVKNKGLSTGDRIGSYLDKNEAYPGEHTIVGIVDGPSIVSFSSLETWIQTYRNDPYNYGIIILPKKGMLGELNKYLSSLPVQGLDVRTLESVSSQHLQGIGDINIILTIINITVIIIVSLCAGFLCYIYFYQRRTEFGLLSAIGFTRQSIVNRALAEVSGINMAGFAAGILASLITAVLLNNIVFLPHGQLLVLWDFDYIIKVFCIPLFVTLFSVIPIWRMLRKLDPMAIIEGEG